MQSITVIDFKVTCAGAFAGVLGTIIGFPFDTIKTKMQTSSGNHKSMHQTFLKVLKNDGFIKGLYNGVGSPLVALTVLNMMNFSSYSIFRKYVGVKEENISRSFDGRVVIAGALSGPLAALISTPFELVKTQMQLSKKLGSEYRNSLEAALSICKQNGVLSLYTGHIVNTTREIVFLGTYFGVYEHSKLHVISLLSYPGMNAYTNQVAIPLAGGMSGAIGWFVSFPLDCIKSNIQGQMLHNTNINRNMIIVGVRLFQNQGLLGLYQGLVPSIMRAFLVSSSRFSAYEGALWMLG